jgi:hypothetical protein
MAITLERPRPAAKWCDVTTNLADFAIITYAVDPGALQALLPPGFEPDVFTLENGRDTAFVSAVPFRDQDFHFTFAPLLRFAFGQTNYRAYVRHNGRRCVWFFGTSLATPLVAIPRHLWNLPWHPVNLTFYTKWIDGCCCCYEYAASGDWGNAECELVGTTQPTGKLDGFRDHLETAEVLTHPLDGYYNRLDGTIGTYSVWHDLLQLHRAKVIRARFEVFENLGLIKPGDEPHSALVQQTTEFVICLPPRKLEV